MHHGFSAAHRGKSFDALGCKNESPLLEPFMEPRFEDRGGARRKHCVKHNGRCSTSTRIHITGPLSTSAATRRHSRRGEECARGLLSNRPWTRRRSQPSGPPGGRLSECPGIDRGIEVGKINSGQDGPLQGRGRWVDSRSLVGDRPTGESTKYGRPTWAGWRDTSVKRRKPCDLLVKRQVAGELLLCLWR